LATLPYGNDSSRQQCGRKAANDYAVRDVEALCALRPRLPACDDMATVLFWRMAEQQFKSKKKKRGAA